MSWRGSLSEKFSSAILKSFRHLVEVTYSIRDSMYISITEV